MISTNDLYGGSYRQMMKIHAPVGIKTQFVGMDKPKNIEKKINKDTKMIWVESPNLQS